MARPRGSKWLNKLKTVDCSDPYGNLERSWCTRLSRLNPELGKRFKFTFTHDGDDVHRLDVVEKKTKANAGFVAVRNVPSLRQQRDYDDSCARPSVHQAEIAPQYRSIGLYQEMLRRMTYDLQDEFYCSRLYSEGGSKLVRSDPATKAWAKIAEAERDGDRYSLEGLKRRKRKRTRR